MTTLEQSGTYPKPGPIGRIARLLLGVLLLNGFIDLVIVPAYNDFVSLSPPSTPGIWITTALAFLFVADLVNITFGRSWGRWPQLVVALVGLLAVVFDRVQYGTFYGPATGLLVYVLLVWFTGFAGLSFLVQAIFATPG
jgi:hypothetical protein